MNNDPGPNRGLPSSVANAFRGLFLLIKTQRNARIHILAAVTVCAAAWIFGIGPWQKVAIVLCIGFVLAAEGFNSALERLADRITAERDPLIGEAKDLAAGAVLIAAITSVTVAIIIVLHHLYVVLPHEAR